MHDKKDPTSAHASVHALIFGRVQGVFFRESTRRKAGELALTGWVRNVRDGSVECRIQGTSQAVEEMVNWLHQGPASAHVTEVITDNTARDDSLTVFRIIS